MPAVKEEEEEEAEVEHVINVDKLGISLVHANLVLEVEEDTAHLVVEVAEVRRKLGEHFQV